MAISKLQYDILLRDNDKSSLKPKLVKTHVPAPDYFDYRRGYIVRYFIQRFNDINAPVYEVNSTDYNKFSLDEFWNTVTLEWRLIGYLEEIQTSNEKSVKLASKKMPGILMYVPNYLQFSGF
jgi:hypothetical protein